MNSIDNFITAISNMNYTRECKSNVYSSDDDMVASIESNTLQIGPKNMTLQIANTKVGLLIDSGGVCSILSDSLISEIINISSLALG